MAAAFRHLDSSDGSTGAASASTAES
jgi:hypothetical protein